MNKIERAALQAAVATGSLVPLAAGGAGMLFGPAMLGVAGGGDLDSHYRYLSGLLFAVGLEPVFDSLNRKQALDS